MSYTVNTFEQNRDLYLQAIVNQDPDAAIGSDSDNYVRACAIAAVLEGVEAHVSWVYRQAFADLADPDVMERMAAQAGLTRKTTNAASGTVQFSGTATTDYPVGTQVFTSTGQYYTTTTDAVVGTGGSVTAQASATVAGAARNSARRCTRVMRLATGWRLRTQSSAESPPPMIITRRSRKCSMRRTE